MGELFQSAEFWVLIAFIVFIGAIGKKAYVGITGGLDARADKIKTEIDEAVRLREEAQALLAGYQRQQRDALKETEAMLEQAREVAEVETAQAKVDLRAVLKRRGEAAKEKIAQAEARALKDVHDATVDIALAATVRVIADSLDEARAAKLVDAATKDLGQRLN